VTRAVARALAVCALALLCAAGVARRMAVIQEYRNFAGDGWQYFHLAEQLVKSHRYAFAPPPVPPAWTRLPGYPLFVAWFGHFGDNFQPDNVGYLVARAQCFVDVLTALFAFLLAREAGLRAPPWLALALCLGSPLLALCVAYVLTETLAICLATLTLWLLLRACRGDLRRWLALAGAALGVGMLVRADAVTLAPCFAVPLLFARAPTGEKARASLLALLAALAVVAPWLLRNQARFRAPHPTGAEWVTKQGDPLPTGAQAWLRTWAVDPEQAAHLAWPITRGAPLGPWMLPPEAYDTADERARVLKIFDDYNRSGIVTPSVDEAFRKLADERRARDRVRYFARLPWKRLRQLWREPVPEWEMPIQSRALKLPEARAQLLPLTERTLLLALIGLALSFSLRRARPLAVLAVVAAVARSLAIVFVVPGGTQRYTFELLPLQLALAAIAIVAPAELILRKLATRSNF